MPQPLRELSFWLRNTVTVSLPAWKRAVSLDSLRGELEARALSTLERQFDLTRWAEVCDAQDWRESLYVLDVLSRTLPKDLPPGRALDVGSKNGTYLPGLVTAQLLGWDAVELDAHRRYLWGSTRRVYGEAMARHFPDCRFIAGDVRSLEGPWALVTWFLPFLSEAPLDAWGLPVRELVPEQLLRHVTDRIVPRGALLVVNQGDHEADLQWALFQKLGLKAAELGRIDSPLSPFRRERFGFLWRRQE
jgi:hypothetical protein